MLDVEPFSLENLPVNRESHYQAQANPVKIDSEDEAIILPYIKWPSIKKIDNFKQAEDSELPFGTGDIKTIEEFSVEYAVYELKKQYPEAQIEVMPHNNPGFDALLTENGKVVRYVEIKGTRIDKPIFNLTENERRFSADNARIYTLLVVWNIDLVNRTYRITRHDGEISVGKILRPERYIGNLV